MPNLTRHLYKENKSISKIISISKRLSLLVIITSIKLIVYITSTPNTILYNSLIKVL